MPINVQREFSRVGLASGGGAPFAPAPLPSGDLEVTQATGGANMRRFDTIARAIDTTTRALVEQGDATAGLGEIMVQGSSGVARTFNRIERRKQEIRDRHEAATARVNYLRGAGAISHRAIEDSDPAGTNIVPRVEQDLAELREKTLAGLRVRDPGVRQSLDGQLAITATKTILAAQRQASDKENKFLARELDKREAAYIAQALQHRGETQEQLLGVLVSDIRDAEREGLIDPATANRKIAASRLRVLNGTIEIDSANDAVEAKRRHDKGLYGHLYVREAEEVAAAEKIGRAIATQRKVAVERLKDLSKAHMASLQETGRGIPGLRGQVANLTPNLLETFDEDDRQARAFFGVMQDIRWADPEQLSETLTSLTPVPGEKGSAGALKFRETALKAFEARQKALAGDPVAYASRHPQVKSLADNIALQRTLGVAKPLEMSRAEAAGWKRKLEQAAPDAAIELLGRFSETFSQTGIDQLSAAVQDERPALALAVHRAKSMPEVSQDVLEGLGALAEHPDRRPHADAMEARLEAVFGDAFEFSEHLRRPVLEAAAAIYARRDPVGAAPFDARAFDAALRRVGGAVRDAAGNMKGGPFEYKGRVILPPGPGLGAAEMDAILAGATEATLLEYGNGRPVDALGRAYTAEDIRAHGGLVTVDAGQYQVWFDDPQRFAGEELPATVFGGEGDESLIGGGDEDELRSPTVAAVPGVIQLWPAVLATLVGAGKAAATVIKGLPAPVRREVVKGLRDVARKESSPFGKAGRTAAEEILKLLQDNADEVSDENDIEGSEFDPQTDVDGDTALHAAIEAFEAGRSLDADFDRDDTKPRIIPLEGDALEHVTSHVVDVVSSKMSESENSKVRIDISEFGKGVQPEHVVQGFAKALVEGRLPLRGDRKAEVQLSEVSEVAAESREKRSGRCVHQTAARN